MPLEGVLPIKLIQVISQTEKGMTEKHVNLQMITPVAQIVLK